LPGLKFRKTIGPAWRYAMRSRGVDDLNCRIFDKPDRLARGIVRQAEENRVGRVERIAPRRRIFAMLFGQNLNEDF